MKRLWPLYIGLFFQGMVFWYVIEKLFMSKLGFNSGLIGISVAIISVIAFLTEVPSGILADRWSRKKTLALSSICLVICAIIGVISDNVPIYLICSAFFGLYMALSSGTTESMVYDVLLEEKIDTKNYEHEYGKTEVCYSIALILSSIIGGIICQYISIRASYLLSIPTALISTFFLLIFKEPKIHKQNQDKSLIKHIKLTFGSVFKNKNLLLLIISLLSSMIIFSILIEMGQIWIVTLSAPVMIYSVMQSLNTSVFGIGGMLSRFFKSKQKIIIGMLITLISLLCLVYSRNILVIVFAVFLILLFICGIRIIITHIILDSLPPQVRAGSLSSISAVNRMFVIPISIFFGYLATKFNIFSAGWLLIALIIISIIAFVFNKLGYKDE